MNITARNVNTAFMNGLWYMNAAGVEEESRNGPVLVAPEPVITKYERPQERVLFNPVRDANPVFHLMEAIWMLSGADDVKFLLPFNSQFGKYAEDDMRVHGAYGARWWGIESAIDMPQIMAAGEILRKDRNSRRVVVQMWDSNRDLGADKRDVPCNTQIYFDARGGVLNMTVTNRSNDMLWGAYGANVVHMSMLQEWMAAYVGIPIGVYYQFSNNFHLYTALDQVKQLLDNPPHTDYDFYEMGAAQVIPMVAEGEDPHDFATDCMTMANQLESPYYTRFMREVASPLGKVYLMRKAGNHGYMELLETIPDCDWKLAFTQWLARREGA